MAVYSGKERAIEWSVWVITTTLNCAHNYVDILFVSHPLFGKTINILNVYYSEIDAMSSKLSWYAFFTTFDNSLVQIDFD